MALFCANFASPNRVFVFPDDTALVSSGDLTGTLTVDDNLSAQTTALTVAVQLSGATLSGATATVTITGTNSGGSNQTSTLTFNSGNLGTAQTTSETYATITGVTTTGFSAGTVIVSANNGRAIAGRVFNLPSGLDSSRGLAIDGNDLYIVDNDEVYVVQSASA